MSSARFEVRVRSTELLPVDVFFPSTPDGFPTGSAHPAVVLLQGGAVDVERYHWLAEAVARGGMVVALPHHASRLAILSLDDGAFARQLLIEPPEGSLLTGAVNPDRIAVGGHSLGGVVAVKLALQGGFAAAALLASLPDPADAAALPGLGLPTLSLAGAQDCQAQLDEVRAGWEQLPSPSVLAVLSGATHYQFTDDDSPDRTRDCPPTASLEDSHRRIAAALVAFLEPATSSGTTGADGLRGIDGLTVEER
ncbi:MAG: alpha/beta hydrolase [Myxococcota bacterium]|nr:alpha/beta hydrolase [Myxococcota bacterium]